MGRLVQIRTRIMNQLHALAMNEGYRWKKKLFSEQGRAQLEKLALAPWASRRRQELLELLDRMNPTIEELIAPPIHNHPLSVYFQWHNSRSRTPQFRPGWVLGEYRRSCTSPDANNVRIICLQV
jgi:hypothetical protein